MATTPIVKKEFKVYPIFEAKNTIYDEYTNDISYVCDDLLCLPVTSIGVGFYNNGNYIELFLHDYTFYAGSTNVLPFISPAIIPGLGAMFMIVVLEQNITSTPDSTGLFPVYLYYVGINYNTMTRQMIIYLFGVSEAHDAFGMGPPSSTIGFTIPDPPPGFCATGNKLANPGDYIVIYPCSDGPAPVSSQYPYLFADRPFSDKPTLFQNEIYIDMDFQNGLGLPFNQHIYGYTGIPGSSTISYLFRTNSSYVPLITDGDIVKELPSIQSGRFYSMFFGIPLFDRINTILPELFISGRYAINAGSLYVGNTSDGEVFFSSWSELISPAHAGVHSIAKMTELGSKIGMMIVPWSSMDLDPIQIVNELAPISGNYATYGLNGCIYISKPTNEYVCISHIFSWIYNISGNLGVPGTLNAKISYNNGNPNILYWGVRWEYYLPNIDVDQLLSSYPTPRSVVDPNGLLDPEIPTAFMVSVSPYGTTYGITIDSIDVGNTVKVRGTVYAYNHDAPPYPLASGSSPVPAPSPSPYPSPTPSGATYQNLLTMFNYVRAYLLDSSNNVAAMGTGWINYETGEYVVELINPGLGDYTLWVIATSRDYVVGEHIPPPPSMSPTPTPSASPSPTPTPSESPSPTPTPAPTSQAGGALAPEYGIAEPYVSTPLTITVSPSPTPTATPTSSPTPAPSCRPFPETGISVLDYIIFCIGGYGFTVFDLFIVSAVLVAFMKKMR